MATVKPKTRLQPEDVPDWVARIIESLANRENITLEQATRMCIFQGVPSSTNTIGNKKWSKQLWQPLHPSPSLTNLSTQLPSGSLKKTNEP
jgi:hypothetical protein